MSEGNGHNGEKPPEKQGESREYRVGDCRPPKETQFKPGQSGNPGGRAKGRTVLSEIHTILEDEAERVALAKACIEKAKDGSFPHLQEIIQRQDGKVPDKVQVDADVRTDVVEEDTEYRQWQSERARILNETGSDN